MAGSDAPSLQVPDGFDIFSARFSRDGEDLVVAAEGSPPLTVIDYFSVDSPPALEMPSGAMLRGDVVELLAGPRAPGQYAQADGPDGAEAIGQIETLSGSSTATRVSGETVQLAQGDPVFQGDVIETAGDSTLGIRLEDGTLASMSAQSRLVLNEFVFEAGGSDNWMLVDLVEGAFAFLTGAIAPSGGMEITTPVAVMAIRGTMPVAFVAGEGGASQFFAASDEDYELLHLTTREVLAVISSESGFSLSSPDAPLEAIELDPATLDEIEGLLDVLNDAAAELGLLGIQDGSGFHTYTPFGSIDGNLASLIEFLLLLDGALTEEAVLEVDDPDQFLMADAELVALPDQAATDEMNDVVIDVLNNDSHSDNSDLTVVFADVPNGQGSVTVVDGQFLVFNPGTDFDYLALGETKDVVITYVVSDSTGAVASSSATVTLTGINQAPVIAGVGETSLDEQTNTQPINATIPVTFTDVDLNNVGHEAAVVGVAVSGEDGGLALGNAALMALVTPGTVTKNAGSQNGSVDFEFTAASGVFDYLADGEVVTLTYTVAIDDGDGGTTLQTFDVTMTGTNDAPVIDETLSDVAATVVEAGFNAAGNPVGDPDASGQIDASDVDNGGRTFSAAQTNGSFGVFAINAAGEWTYTLDDAAAGHLALGQTRTEVFEVTVTDGFGATDVVSVTITVEGSNDTPRVQNVALAATEDGPAVLAGFIGGDGDSDDNSGSLTYNVAQPDVGSVINNGDGTFSFDPGNDFQDLGAGDTRDVTFTYTSTDSHGLMSAPATVTVTVTGTNDVPVVTGVSTGAVSEDAHPTTLTTGGALTIVDADAGESSFVPQTNVAGTYGSFTLLADGTWSYSADNTQAAIQELGDGDTLTDSFTAVSSDGTVSRTITVTIHGDNDGAVIGGDVTGSVTEDVDVADDELVTGGTLSIDDGDAGEETFAPQSGTTGSNGYGSFTLLADGTWSYSADNTQAAIQELGEGETLTDSFIAVSSDGAEQVVTVTIHGTNDAAVLSSADVTRAETNAALQFSGQLTISDIDGDDKFVAQTGVTGTYGTFSVDENGNWTFTANSAFDHLNVGDSVSETFTVAAVDGTTTTVKVTITGTEDAAVLSSANVTRAETNAVLEFSGQLTISDVDSADKFVAQTDVAGTHGTFSIDENGNWTFTANSAFNHLNVGDSVSETFTVAAVDGTTTTVKVTITGTNDGPVADLNGGGAGIDNDVTFDRDGPVEIAADGMLADVDNDTLQSMTVRLTNRPDGNNEGLSLTAAAMTLATAAGLVIHSYDPANGTLLITGEGSLAEYEAVLQGIVYDNASERPTGGDREIEVVVSDGDLSSTVATTTVDVIPAPDVISFAWLTVDDPNPNEYQVDDLGEQHERLFAIVGDGDEALDSGETAYRLSNNDNTQGGILNNNDANDPVIISTDGPNVTFDNETGFGVKEQGSSGQVNDAFLNDGQEIKFELTGAMVLAVVAFTVNASGASANVVIDFNGVEFDLGNLSNGTKVTIDFVNETIDLGQGTSLPPGFDTDAFFEAYAAAGRNEITIGSDEEGGAFSIKDLELTPKEASGTDPIILDLGAPGFDLSATAGFDLTNDGEQQLLGWPGGEDGMLVMDVDGSNAIESGNEVFSPYFDGGGFADALDALASLDVNGDGVIDAQDAAFADLLVWVDANSDGQSQSGELISFAELGITSLNLDTEGVAYTIDGQTIVAEGLFTTADGSTGDFVAVELLEVAEPQGELLAATDLSIDEVILDYQEGDAIDLTRLGFELATGQLEEGSAGECVGHAAEFVAPPPSILVRLSDGDSTADVEIA